MPVPLPSLKEQQKIGSILSIVDELIQKTDQLIEQTQRLKISLMQRLLTKGIGHTKFKKTGLGNIPNSWTSTMLNRVCNKIQDGSHFSPKKQYKTTGTNRFLYITSKNIRESGIDLSTATYVDREFHDAIYRRCDPERDDVLLVKDGVMTGIAIINTIDEPFSLLSSVTLIKTQKNLLDPHYLKHYLVSPLGFKMITNQMTGTAIRRITLDKIRASLIPLPPILEQQKIASILSNIDELIKLKKQESFQFKIIKKGLMQKLLTGKIRVKI
jgi:type I restriction enzyme S subunit